VLPSCPLTVRATRCALSLPHQTSVAGTSLMHTLIAQNFSFGTVFVRINGYERIWT